jgi:hypothetical protein
MAAAPKSVKLYHLCGECRDTEFTEPVGRFHPVCGVVDGVRVDGWPDADRMVICAGRRTVARGQQRDAGTKSTPVIARVEDANGVGPVAVYVYTSYTCRACFARRPRENFRCVVCQTLQPLATVVEVNAREPGRTRRWCVDCVRETPAYICGTCQRPCEEFAADGHQCASCAGGFKRCGECGDAWHKDTFDRCYACKQQATAEPPPAKRQRLEL